MRFLTLLAVFAATVPLFSQKVDLDAEPIPVRYVRLPQKPMPTDHKTYSVIVSANPKDLQSIGLSELALSKPFNKLSGFNRIPSGGDFNIEINLDDFRWGKNETKTKTNTFKDKNGKETKTTTYYAYQEYVHDLKTIVQTREGKLLVNRSWLFSDRPFTSKEFNTQSELSKYQNQQLGKDVAIQDQKEILAALKQAYSLMDSYYGYSPVTEETQLWVLDSEKHPEYAQHQSAYKTIKMAFEKMTDNETLDIVKVAAQPALDFWEQKKDTYDVSEKTGKKMRYSCLFNLATAHFWLENFDQAERYANDIVTNDYDKKDGEKILEAIAGVRSQYEQTGKTTRHFVVASPAKDSTGTATDETGQPVVYDSDREERIEAYKNEKLKLKPGTQRYEGTIKYTDGNEFKGFFLVDPVAFNMLIFGSGGNVRFYLDKGEDVQIIALDFSKITQFAFNNLKFYCMKYSAGDMNIGKGENTIMEVVYESDKLGAFLAYTGDYHTVADPREYALFDIENRELSSLNSVKYLLNFNKGLKKEFGEKCPALLEAIEKDDFKRINKDIERLAKILDGCLYAK